MSIEEHIEYWLQTSNDDFEVFKLLLDSENYLHSFYIAHLAFEKLLKAHWVKDNNNVIPPKIHNLVSLVKQTKLELSFSQLEFLTILNDFQIQGRYPDYKFKVKKMLTREYVNKIVPQINELKQCLQNLII